MKPFQSPPAPAIKRAFVVALIISFASHALVLSMPIMGARSPARPEKIVTVRLTEPLPPPPEIDEAPAEAAPSPTPPAKAASKTVREEQTVNLDNPDRRYRDYLLKVRQRIENRWSYPPNALQKREEGVIMIKFTLAASGALAGQEIISSSGSLLLDEHTQAVIRHAAPYDRLPEEMRLARLHIVATFHYRIK